MVATGHPLATAAAHDVLRTGGNAVDAAIAAAGVLAVVQPEMCGLGGDAFLLIYWGATHEVVALNGSGAAPRAVADGSTPAERIAAGVRSAGGVLETIDLAEHHSEWLPPAQCVYAGREILVQPPVSQGVVALEVRPTSPFLAFVAVGRTSSNRLRLGPVSREAFSAEALGALRLIADDMLATPADEDVDSVHLMVEAMRLAFADRDSFLADPRWASVDLTPFTDVSRAAARRAVIDRGHARAGSPSAAASREGGTSYLCVVDASGNAVSLIQSLFSNFGSGIVAGHTGILMNNRGSAFSANRDSPNALAPGKRPVHTRRPGSDARTAAGAPARRRARRRGSHRTPTLALRKGWNTADRATFSRACSCRSDGTRTPTQTSGRLGTADRRRPSYSPGSRA